MAIKAGVRRPLVDFSPEEIKQYGIYSVKIKIPVQGTYSNAVNFIKALETSDTFFLINSIDVKTSVEGTPGNSVSSVALSLSLETFFYK